MVLYGRACSNAEDVKRTHDNRLAGIKAITHDSKDLGLPGKFILTCTDANSLHCGRDLIDLDLRNLRSKSCLMTKGTKNKITERINSKADSKKGAKVIDHRGKISKPIALGKANVVKIGKHKTIHIVKDVKGNKI